MYSESYDLCLCATKGRFMHTNNYFRVARQIRNNPLSIPMCTQMQEQIIWILFAPANFTEWLRNCAQAFVSKVRIMEMKCLLILRVILSLKITLLLFEFSLKRKSSKTILRNYAILGSMLRSLFRVIFVSYRRNKWCLSLNLIFALCNEQWFGQKTSIFRRKYFPSRKIGCRQKYVYIKIHMYVPK
jgi:hypothetical protein